MTRTWLGHSQLSCAWWLEIELGMDQIWEKQNAGQMFWHGRLQWRWQVERMLKKRCEQNNLWQKMIEMALLLVSCKNGYRETTHTVDRSRVIIQMLKKFSLKYNPKELICDKGNHWRLSKFHAYQNFHGSWNCLNLQPMSMVDLVNTIYKNLPIFLKILKNLQDALIQLMAMLVHTSTIWN